MRIRRHSVHPDGVRGGGSSGRATGGGGFDGRRNTARRTVSVGSQLKLLLAVSIKGEPIPHGTTIRGNRKKPSNRCLPSSEFAPIAQPSPQQTHSTRLPFEVLIQTLLNPVLRIWAVRVGLRFEHQGAKIGLCARGEGSMSDVLTSRRRRSHASKHGPGLTYVSR